MKLLTYTNDVNPVKRERNYYFKLTIQKEFVWTGHPNTRVKEDGTERFKPA